MSASAPLCAYCRQHAAVTAFTPFCSQRCKMADLGQWLSGTYRVAGAAGDDGIDSQDETSEDDSDSQEHSS